MEEVSASLGGHSNTLWVDTILLDVLMVGTLEGDMRAALGDWIIKGVAGEVYPCKPDIFDATYEKVND